MGIRHEHVGADSGGIHGEPAGVCERRGDGGERESGGVAGCCGAERGTEGELGDDGIGARERAWVEAGGDGWERERSGRRHGM